LGFHFVTPLKIDKSNLNHFHVDVNTKALVSVLKSRLRNTYRLGVNSRGDLLDLLGGDCFDLELVVGAEVGRRWMAQ
jgi:hypothetical protein